MDSGKLASMYAQIVNGVPKEKSHYVTDEESSALWDQIAAEVTEARNADPNIVFSIPNEMPDAADDEDEPDESTPLTDDQAAAPEPVEPEDAPESTAPEEKPEDAE